MAVCREYECIYVDVQNSVQLYSGYKVVLYFNNTS